MLSGAIHNDTDHSLKVSGLPNSECHLDCRYTMDTATDAATAVAAPITSAAAPLTHVLGDALDSVTKSIPVSSTISHLYYLHDALSQDTDVCCR